MGSIWESVKGFWHDLWAPSPATPAPAPAPAPPEMDPDAKRWREMTQGACPTVVPITPNPTAADAQAEYLACMAGSPIGIDMAPKPPMPSPYGDTFN